MSGLVVGLMAVWLMGLGTPAAHAAGVTRYVAVTGSDTSAGTSSAPFRTISKGLRSLVAGDTLVVRGGTYAEQVRNPTIAAGTASAPIRVVAAPGERPVIAGLFWLKAPTFWTIEGINVTWSDANVASEHMVKLTDGTDWTYTSAEIWGARSYAAVLVVGNPSRYRLTDLYVHDTYPSNGTNQDHLIYVNAGSGGGSVDHNLLVGSPNGRAVKVGGASSTSAAVSNVTIAYNTMVDNLGPSNVQLAWKTYNTQIHHNIMVRSAANRSNVTAYELTGTGNSASANIGWDAPRVLDQNQAGLADLGGNLLTDPQLNAAYEPTASIAIGYGHTAGSTAPPPPPPSTTTTTVAPTTTTTVAPTTTTTVAPAAVIRHRASTSVASGPTTNVAIGKPQGVQAGDVMVAAIDVRGTPTITAPAGWSLIRQDVNGTTMRKASYYRVATASEPSSYAWTLSSSQSVAGGIDAFSGVKTSAPIHGHSGLVATVRSTSVVAPSVTTTVADTMAVALFAQPNTATVTPPTGFSERRDVTSAGPYIVTSGSADGPVKTAGPTGDQVAQSSSSGFGIGQLVVLSPATA